MAETGKKRTARIPLDYYKRPDRLESWKLRLSLVALLLAGGWASGVGADLWNGGRWGERSRQLVSHGPLARPHATWESRCDACHLPFLPIGTTTWTSSVTGTSALSDARCRSCHAGPIHHASQEPGDLACAGCHHDHQGRDASLVRIADRHCTGCHSDLDAHIAGQAPVVVGKVTRFDADPDHHPEFRATQAEDPGSLKFNHARHLTRGMPPEGGGPVQTLAMLREADRNRYQGYARGAEGAIELDCAACHRLDAEDFGIAPRKGSTRDGGAYLLPIAYENQCRACHPLDYDPASPALTMAHGLQPAEVHTSLWQTYAAQYLAQNPALLDRRIEPRPMPGRPEAPEAREAREAVERKVQTAEKILLGARKCGECHQFETVAREVRIRPTNVPEVWFPSAVFDHTAHRAVGCRECHERAYPGGPNASVASKDVLLPTIKTCLACHGPQRTGTTLGGAGADCTECHRYHNGDASLQGPGASARGVDPDDKATIREFLQGVPAP